LAGIGSLFKWKKDFMKMKKMILLIPAIVVSLMIMHARVLLAETERDPDIDIRMRFAIVEGNAESVKKNLEEGANPNVIYSDGVTPIADAINRSRAPIDIVKVLILSGADPKLKSNGNSPLSLAIKMNNEELIRILHDYAESDAELYDVALFFLSKENEISALEYADKTLKLNPNNVNAWALKGAIFLSPNYYNIKYAEMAYHKAFESSLINLKANKSEDNYKATVWYALLSSDFSEALRLAREGLSVFPGDVNLRLGGGHALLLLGKKEGAIVFYKKAYADLQRTEYADRSSQVMTNAFASMINRYPDKASELKWAEEKVQEPFDFNFFEIPFGEGKDQVLGMVKGATVRGEVKPVLGRLDPVVMMQLKRGLYPVDSDTQLNPEFAEKYSVAYPKWGALQSIDIYFTGQQGQRTLFLVSKYYKETGKSDDIFIRYQETISQETKISAVVHTTEIASSSGPLPVKIAIWKSKNTTIILDVLHVSSDSSQLRIMYVSRNGWGKYVRSADPAKSR
jgi:ankyrin repeat protein